MQKNEKIVILLVSFISASILSQQQGNVGVNTTTPQKTLHVNGSLQVTNELNVGGDDKTAGDAGNVGQVLTSQGSNKAPAWSSIPIPTAGKYYLKDVYQMDIGKGVATRPYTSVLLSTLNNIEVTSENNFLYILTQNNTYIQPNTETGISYRFDFYLDEALVESTSWQTINRQGFADAALNNPYQFLIQNVKVGSHSIGITGFRQHSTNSGVSANLYFNTLGSDLRLKKRINRCFCIQKV